MFTNFPMSAPRDLDYAMFDNKYILPRLQVLLVFQTRMVYNFHGIGVPFQQNNFLLPIKSTEIGIVSPKNTQQIKKIMLSKLRSPLYAHIPKFPGKNLGANVWPRFKDYVHPVFTSGEFPHRWSVVNKNGILKHGRGQQRGKGIINLVFNPYWIILEGELDTNVKGRDMCKSASIYGENMGTPKLLPRSFAMFDTKNTKEEEAMEIYMK